MNSPRPTFNNPIELGTRASLLLTAVQEKLTKENIVVLDYMMLYSKEFGGPENLHPPMPNHIAEISFRMEMIPAALQLFAKRGVLDFEFSEKGEFFFENEQTRSFVSCLQSTYYRKAWERLDWIASNKSEFLCLTLSNISQAVHDS